MVRKINHMCRPHSYQDTVYGSDKRVFNPTVSGSAAKTARCTVCGAEEIIREAAPPKKDEKEKK